MAQQAIFGPFFAMMFLTLVVWVYMYARRISFLTRNNIRPDEVASPEAARTRYATRRLDPFR